MKHPDTFTHRHLGPNEQEVAEMLKVIGVSSMEQLIDETIPAGIRINRALNIPEAMTEYEYLTELRKTAAKNQVFRSHIGLGYYDTITPPAILRNVFENPGWYTQYTPYQAEISQGRMEALLNFQTMVSDLTGLPVANASLLDESTAAAEAMYMTFNHKNRRAKGDDVANVILVSDKCFPQTIDLLQTRADGVGIEVKVSSNLHKDLNDKVFAAIVQYPDVWGEVDSCENLGEKLHAQDSFLIVATDLLALTMLKSPGELGADVAVGSAQRFGVPMGFGGPHAAFFAVKEEFLRNIPGRIIGISVDANGKPALRMALQTREQHIRREKATSNICTAQALLAIMAGMYAVYHGPKGLKGIAEMVHYHAVALNEGLKQLGLVPKQKQYFDTVSFELTAEQVKEVKRFAKKMRINFHYTGNVVTISVDETTNSEDITNLIGLFAAALGKMMPALALDSLVQNVGNEMPAYLLRTSEYLTHPVFNSHHSETAIMRYIKRLENKDLSLNTSMIPLGSCTMKLNAAAELIPVSWAEFNKIHPFAPAEQTKGYQQIIKELGDYLCEITGFAGISFQPNSGAQGEYAGLLVIREYHRSRKDFHRNVILIPSSAHGTNPASAAIAGFKIVVTKTAEDGTIDVADLKAKAEQYKDVLAGLMVTYPSTHGVFEETIQDICQTIHNYGGQVYMDGANMNAQVGLTSPGFIGADVCHLNLHKTFAIPHGGGGPGMGPICVAAHLTPFLPGHVMVKTGGKKAISAVSAAPYGSTSILLISYGYIKMLGRDGVKKATEYAILNANYLKSRLESKFKILYTANSGRVAHEFIMDMRMFKAGGVEIDDIVKRLIDYGFHAPTVSFPVAGTLMIEPTESEPLAELDRFCDAMLGILSEIEEVISGEVDLKDNVLKNSPHTQEVLLADEWTHSYPRSKAAYPVKSLIGNKFWASVGRVDNAYGDRNVVCVCPPIEAYQTV